MNILIDTHIPIWIFENNMHKLSTKEVDIISNPLNNIFISYATFWEISLKCQKNQFNFSYKEFLEKAREVFQVLPISLKHIENLKKLEPIHGDPFDRILISQAYTEKYILITHDKKILQYDCNIFL